MVMEETIVRIKLEGFMVDDIPSYILPRKLGALVVWINKNQKYTIKIPTTPKGVHVMMNIVPRLHKIQYRNHEILAYSECKEVTYEEIKHSDRGPITREPTKWAL